MDFRRGCSFFLVAAVAAAFFVLQHPAEASEGEPEKEDIWSQTEQRGPRSYRRFELTEDEIGRIMRSLKKENPRRAKQLESLREKDPEQFKALLREHGGSELTKIMVERAEAWIQRRQAEFLEWLEKNYRKVAQELGKLKQKNPGLYAERVRHVQEKYEPIYEAERRNNPELAAVLKEDLDLKEKRVVLLKKIWDAKGEKEKARFRGQLEQIVAQRFDLIVRRKQIAYSRLLRWIAELQKRVEESRKEIAKWEDVKFKAENVKSRTEDLIRKKVPFKWD